MTVIAKLYAQEVTEFGTGTFAQLACIANSDLMAAYATSDEDKLFSRYSPWGEIRLHQRSGWCVFTKAEQHVGGPWDPKAYYAVMQPAGEIEADRFKGAEAFVKINCYSTMRLAQDGTRVELREVYDWKKLGDEEAAGPSTRSRAGVIEKLSWKMHVDNPPAEAQFVAGENYWLAFYDASRFNMQEALAAAHGHGA